MSSWKNISPIKENTVVLNNSQYDAIMRDYSRRQIRHRHIHEERQREVYARVPRIREIEEEIASASVRQARRLLGGEEGALFALKEQLRLLGEERDRLLCEAGYPPDYLQMTYDCPLCRDQGFVDGQKCSCFKQAQIDLFYTQSHLKDILQQENFETFSYAYYSDDPAYAQNGVTPRSRMEKVTAICRRFAERFDEEHGNLFFFGDTGVGKTFLSHCIAKELLDTTHSVIYFSAQDLMDALADRRFHRERDDGEVHADMICDCDLLIIDDLGTELTSQLTGSELFLCLNERLDSKRSTIISTNLTLEALAQLYSERILSRITDRFTMLKLYGEDIRLQKKKERMARKKKED